MNEKLERNEPLDAAHFLDLKWQVGEERIAMQVHREQFKSTTKILEQQEAEFKEKNTDLKEYVKKFDHFLKETEMKRCRAVSKARRERELINQKEAEICMLREEIQTLTKKRDHVKKRVKNKEVYYKYLESVAHASEQFQEPQEVMSHLLTLMSTRENLLSAAQQNQSRADRARAQLAGINKQCDDQVVHYNHQLGQLQSQLNKAHIDRMLWESKWAHIYNTSAKMTMQIGKFKMATDSLYQSVCKATEDMVSSQDTPTPEQLDKIQDYFQDQKAILLEATAH